MADAPDTSSTELALSQAIFFLQKHGIPDDEVDKLREPLRAIIARLPPPSAEESERMAEFLARVWTRNFRKEVGEPASDDESRVKLLLREIGLHLASHGLWAAIVYIGHLLHLWVIPGLHKVTPRDRVEEQLDVVRAEHREVLNQAARMLWGALEQGLFIDLETRLLEDPRVAAINRWYVDERGSDGGLDPVLVVVKTLFNAQRLPVRP